MPYGPFVLNISGTVKTVYQWNASNSNDLPPLKVIAHEHIYPLVTGFGGVSAGVFNSGMQVQLGTSGYGDNWSVVDVNQSTKKFEVISPVFTGSIAGTNGGAVVSIFYSSDITNLDLVLGGALNSRLYLIGQACTPRVSSGSYPVTGIGWTVPENRTFQSYTLNPPDTSQPTSSSVQLGPGNLSTPTPKWYWLSENPVDVSCTGFVITPVGPMGFSMSRTALISAPVYTVTATPGIVGIYEDTILRAGGPVAPPTNMPNPSGISFSVTAITPPPFSTSQGNGWIECVQLIQRNRLILGFLPIEIYPFTDFPFWYLDNHYPYSGPFPANNSTNITFDSPEMSLVFTYMQYNVNDLLKMYFIFIPPGSDSQRVPLHLTEWHWSATATHIPIPLPPHWILNSGNVTIDSDGRTTTFPLWSGIVINIY